MQVMTKMLWNLRAPPLDPKEMGSSGDAGGKVYGFVFVLVRLFEN